MQKIVEALREFHRTYEVEQHDKPTWPSEVRVLQRYILQREENGEYLDAAMSRDMVEVADALGDLLYVLVGAFITYGIDPEPVFWAIHKSNMTKLWTTLEYHKAADDPRWRNEHEAKSVIDMRLEKDQGIRCLVVKRRSDEKVIKSPSYEPVDLKSILEAQS